ncbi:MAG: UPF0489 family protein [Myxococcaceae bacterium]|nr:UPF0489 family protein [Myxococcaceae bacterium]MCI0672901.1 UPF0489 family protein [Myxococcaceae bacterium]
MSLLESPHLKLAGVTRLAVAGTRGPKDVYLFDPHRLALPCWALAVGQGPPALLVTLDRHLDLVPPARPAAVPEGSAGLRALDEHARWELDVRNYDHILAAMEAGLVGDALLIGRARPRGCFEGDVYVDRRGQPHRLLVSPTVDRVAEAYGCAATAAPLAREAEALLSGAGQVLLDVDLDCFTSPSDADPTEVLPWPRSTIRSFLMPEGSGAFWDAVLARCNALTLAREPYHCGGVVASGRLFEEVVGVLFGELLGAELP